MAQDTTEAETESTIHSLFERVKDYVETRSELIKLKAIKKGAEVGSALVSTIIVIIVFSYFFLFLNIALGFWLGSLLHETYLGFFALAGFYLIVGIIVYANKEKIIKLPISNSIIKNIND